MKGHYLQKIKKDLKEAGPLVQDWKSKKKQIVFTNGCFDILHSGHLFYLSEARKLGDYLIVGVNSDNSVRRLKGERRPILPLQERMEMLSGLEMVDLVVPFSEDTPLKLIANIQPNILVKGGDYQLHEIVGAEQVIESGGQVKVLSFRAGSSTTNVIDTIVKRYSYDKD